MSVRFYYLLLLRHRAKLAAFLIVSQESQLQAGWSVTCKSFESQKYYGLNQIDLNLTNDEGELDGGDGAYCDGEGLEADLATGNKDTCVLEVMHVI